MISARSALARVTAASKFVDFEPEEDAVAVRLGGGVAKVAVMVIDVPVVELEDELAVGDEALILFTSVSALTVEEALVPAAGGFDVATSKRGWGRIS